MALPDVIDTLDMFAAIAGLAGSGRAGGGDGPRRPRARCRAMTTSRTSWCWGWAAVASPVTWCARSPGPFMPVPVVVHKGYGMPNFISDSSLVFAVSFSGNTEETLEAVGEAVGRRRAHRGRQPRR